MNWSYPRELAGDVFIVGYGTFMLWAFLTIFFKGGFMFAVEPDTALLVLEILLTLGIILLGIERFIDDLE